MNGVFFLLLSLLCIFSHYANAQKSIASSELKTALQIIQKVNNPSIDLTYAEQETEIQQAINRLKTTQSFSALPDVVAAEQQFIKKKNEDFIKLDEHVKALLLKDTTQPDVIADFENSIARLEKSPAYKSLAANYVKSFTIHANNIIKAKEAKTGADVEEKTIVHRKELNEDFIPFITKINNFVALEEHPVPSIIKACNEYSELFKKDISNKLAAEPLFRTYYIIIDDFLENMQKKVLSPAVLKLYIAGKKTDSQALNEYEEKLKNNIIDDFIYLQVMPQQLTLIIQHIDSTNKKIEALYSQELFLIPTEKKLLSFQEIVAKELFDNPTKNILTSQLHVSQYNDINTLAVELLDFLGIKSNLTLALFQDYASNNKLPKPYTRESAKKLIPLMKKLTDAVNNFIIITGSFLDALYSQVTKNKLLKENKNFSDITKQNHSFYERCIKLIGYEKCHLIDVKKTEALLEEAQIKLKAITNK